MKQKLPSDFPDRIRKLRIKFDLTQTRLAELLGVSYASVNRWENGQARPSALAWQKIVRAERDGIDTLEKGYVDPQVVREPKPNHTPENESSFVIDFSGDSEIVRIVAEGERLAYGHLFNPSFATEISLIDPLPHQRIAVYEHMLNQTRLRFLLADDAGAGKTIMAGLYVREMLSRRLIRRVLIAPPAGLVSNWEREMRTLFDLPFRVLSGAEMRFENPFIDHESDLVIISVDTLSGERAFSRLQEPSVQPYDVVIFDEAHKLSADRQPDFTIRRTDRYRLAEALSGVAISDSRWSLTWGCHHLLLLTATPHMGKDFPYFCLWRLVEPEALSTIDAFNAYPADARRRHFLRRTKEEMIHFDGTRIYPTRISDTLSHDLSPGEISEQRLYDLTTDYIQTFYNRARILNRSAARMAMSIFQRRLASSTQSLICSFERRIAKLDGLIDDIQSGKIKPEELATLQRKMEDIHDVLDEMTGDEESREDGREQNELIEEMALGGVVAVSLAELQAEKNQVLALLDLAREVGKADDSKFEKLREVIDDARFKHEKILVFTEYRDTLDFLVRRLEGLGFTGQVAKIHGGMGTRPNPQTGLSERDEQVEFFKRSHSEGGARFMVATDAAGEGINLQFCWLMINYDIPWNPARLEQRMGRIHRYGQQHDPVIIVNLISGKTREGRVLKTLLEKLERIRKELRSDKVFDVVGRLFEGVSLKDYMIQSATEEGAEMVCQKIEGKLTKEQVEALAERERRLFGDGGDVKSKLADQKAQLKREELRRLLPGYVRRFIEKAAPLVDIAIDGELEGIFSLRPLKSYALDPLWPVLETYPIEKRNRLTVHKPKDPTEAIFLHPGESFFDRFRAYVCSRFTSDAQRGGIFIDPYAQQPYMFHFALIAISRKADPNFSSLTNDEIIEYRLVGLKNEESGQIVECPVEHLLLLKGGHGFPVWTVRFSVTATKSREVAKAYATERIARHMVEERRQALLKTLSTRTEFVAAGYDYQDAELAAARVRLAEKGREGNSKAKGDLAKIKERQRALVAQKEEAIALLRREPELLAPDKVIFLAHALVVPSNNPEERKRHDSEVEAIAVQVACAYEEARGAKVKDVSTSSLALAAGLREYPGFDLLSQTPANEERAIEVKGRAGMGEIELTENEWAIACNLRDRYWLYVVYECASPHPRLLRVQDPFRKLIVRAKGGVIVKDRDILDAAEPEAL